MKTVLILANGVWSSDAQARLLAANANLVIAADGGFEKALAAGARVDLVIGDLDSIGDAARVSLSASKIRVDVHPAAKDESDLELALDHALAQRPEHIIIVGGLGLRIDHALTNIHLLERGLDAGVAIELLEGTQSVTLAEGRREVVGARCGDRVSLVPVTESVRVSTRGLRFPLDDEVLRRAASRGVSNVVDDLPAVIAVVSGRLLVIHDRGGAKS